jgi:hypothetical protein
MERAVCLLAATLAAGCGQPPANDDMAAVADMAVVDQLLPQDDLAEPIDLVPFEAPPGQVVAGDVVLRAITSDGWAILSDDKGQVSAVRLSDGTSQPILIDSMARVAQAGATALVWHDLDGSLHGPLALWTATGGKKEVATKSEAPVFAATPDGARLAYIDGYDGTALTENLVSSASDGSAQTTVVTGHDATVPPQLGFVGARLVAWHRDLGGDGGGPSPAVGSFDAQTGAGLDLLRPAAPGWFSDGASTVVVKTPANDASSVSAGGGQLQPLAADVGSGLFLPGGDAVWSGASSHALFRAALGAQPVQLQAAGATDLRALSPDGNWLLYDSMVDPNFRFFYDLTLAPTSAGGAAHSLVPDATAHLFGPGFTADSRYALWLDGVDPTSSLGTLTAFPVAGGGAITVETAVHSWFAVGSAKLLVRGRIDPATALGTLEAIDLDGAVRALVGGCGLALPTPDGKSAAYTLPAGSGAPGLYLVPLP